MANSNQNLSQSPNQNLSQSPMTPTQRRKELQTKLEEFLGSKNVYFKAPESGKMSYPCIKYDLIKMDVYKASNKIYRKDDAYKVTLISKNPDIELKDTILYSFDYISFNTSYKADNLYHYVYTLYY